MPTAIVTGSGGLIGSEAVSHLVQIGFDVVGVDNACARAHDITAIRQGPPDPLRAATPRKSQALDITTARSQQPVVRYPGLIESAEGTSEPPRWISRASTRRGVPSGIHLQCVAGRGRNLRPFRPNCGRVTGLGKSAFIDCVGPSATRGSHLSRRLGKPYAGEPHARIEREAATRLA